MKYKVIKKIKPEDVKNIIFLHKDDKAWKLNYDEEFIDIGGWYVVRSAGGPPYIYSSWTKRGEYVCKSNEREIATIEKYEIDKKLTKKGKELGDLYDNL
jgi:hypothetical protein